MDDTVYFPGAYVVGIAITAQDKRFDAVHGGSGDPQPYDLIKYYKDSITFATEKNKDYRLHCKIFNPASESQYLKISAAMYAGETIGMETILAKVNDLREYLVYPEVLNDEARLNFHRHNLTDVKATFSTKGEKKYLFYQYFVFDNKYMDFYDTPDPISIVFRVTLSPQNNTGGIISQEQHFLWHHSQKAEPAK